MLAGTVAECCFCYRANKGDLVKLRDSSERGILQALRKMKKVCEVIRACFFGAVVVYLAFWIIATVGSIMGAGQSAGTEAVYTVASGFFTLLILWNLTRLFDEVVKSDEPFSEFQADRLRSIAVVALAYVALDFLVSFGFVYSPMPEIGFGMVANNGIAEPTLNLNVGMLAFSAIMYSLLAIFRYAALLQQLSDETV